MLEIFEEIENAYKSETCVSYAHSIVAKPVVPVAPSFVLFVLGTDSKYTHNEIIHRWNYIESDRAIASSIIGGGGGADIHIFVFTNHKNNEMISKEINCAEPEYTNISPPPPPIIELATALESELYKRDVTVYTNGADGAGPFLKGMTVESNLFNISETSNVPVTWSSYMMSSLKSKNLSSQDMVHLLAKLHHG